MAPLANNERLANGIVRLVSRVVDGIHLRAHSRCGENFTTNIQHANRLSSCVRLRVNTLCSESGIERNSRFSPALKGGGGKEWAATLYPLMLPIGGETRYHYQMSLHHVSSLVLGRLKHARLLAASRQTIRNDPH